jgi:hypothetical protein
MKIGWGWKIAGLYTGFAVLILVLVVASSRQKFDLVSKDYYKEEIAYQDVLDAGKNQAGLTAAIAIHASSTDITIEFPAEFRDRVLSGEVSFYSPVNAEWDRKFEIHTSNNTFTIARNDLRNTQYTIKIHCAVDGKKYYQESAIQLHS